MRGGGAGAAAAASASVWAVSAWTVVAVRSRGRHGKVENQVDAPNYINATWNLWPLQSVSLDLMVRVCKLAFTTHGSLP